LIWVLRCKRVIQEKYMTTGQGESEGVSSKSGCGGKVRIQDTHCNSSPKTTQTGKWPQQNCRIYTQAQGWLLNCWRSRPNLSQFTVPTMQPKPDPEPAIAATKWQTICVWQHDLWIFPQQATKSWKYSHNFACSWSCTMTQHKEIYSHDCNEIVEIFP